MASTENSCLKNLAGELLVGLSADLLVDSASAPPRRSAQLQQLSPAALAYVGDAVYELYIRTHYLFPPKRLQVYHHQVVAQVRAESQARHLKSLQPHLTETECEIVRRGRNAASKGPKRVDPDIYQQATALETLFGYLYLCDPQRLVQLLGQLQLKADDADSAKANSAKANSPDANSPDANSPDADHAKDAPVSLG